jgi:Tol biopolymer transport system component
LSGAIIQVTENDYNDSNPRINNNGIIVWWGWYPNYSTEGAPKPEIFLYDSKKDVILQITNDEYTDQFPQISDLGYVVWMGYDGHDWEIYLYDYEAGSTTQLTDNAYDDELPHISSHFVVWQGKVDNQYEIFRAIIGN